MSIYEHFSEEDLNILRARAARAAYTDHEDVEEMLTVLHIMLGSESYALPVMKLSGIYEHVAVASVPCTPPFIAGIANIRGRIMAVLDLMVLLNVPHSLSGVPLSVAVVSRGNASIALQVEKVGEITTFPVSHVTSLPASVDTGRAYYLQGILANGTAMINLDAILNDPQLQVNETII
jgi:purine-binding chemotaxis protein CheW